MLWYQTEDISIGYTDVVVYEDFDFPPHLHMGLELAVTLEGECILTCDGADAALPEGRAALLLPDQIHAYRTENRSKVWVCVFSRDFVPELVAKLRGKVRMKPDFDAGEILMTMVQQNRTEECAMRAVFYEAAGLYLRGGEFTENRAQSGELGYRAIRYISAHFLEDLTLTELGTALGYQPGSVSAALRRTVGCSFPRLVNQYRIEHARQLLLSTDDSMTEIADRSGYHTLRAFNAAFRQCAGMTPSEYRKRGGVS